MLTKYLNPLSSDFIFTKLFKNVGDLFDLFDSTGEKFIFTDFFKNISNIFNMLNPTSDQFLLKGLFNVLNPFSDDFFLKKLFNWINPLSDDFIGKKIVELFGELLKSLFIPSEERITGLQNTVMSKFDFVESIKIAINSFMDIINNLGNAPVLRLNLGATKYTDEMDVAVIDLNWYKPYKQYGDVVLTGIIYAFYLFRLFYNAPNIISGASSGLKEIDTFIEVEEHSKQFKKH